MNGQEATVKPVIDKKAAEIVATGSFSETAAAAGGIAITIIALAGVLPTLLAGIAAIVTGAALLMEGGAVAAKMAGEIAHEESRAEMAELTGGLTSEFIAGAAGVVLGILALIGIAPMTLLAVAAVTFGGGLVMGAMVTTELRHVQVAASPATYARHGIERAVSAANGVRALFGFGAVALGILALNYSPTSLVLSLVAYLVVSVSVLLSGSTVGAKMVSALRH
ncbi:MAG: hypothetical protein P8181_11905 [bacterium]